ncbi:diaminobutyrate--2-oxoglutarate transaminase [Gordonia caeni]|uniref:Diaminobutyrate--2-oxoglutarate transaminase n=1 Tax=Gordonia caeni TaxID=1007097 RepID=A0ABP7P4V5_9ACTN
MTTIDTHVDDKTFTKYESEVRSYCRNWPAIFDTAQGAWLTDVDGNKYLDFFAGAGALNYGHNDPDLKEALLRHLVRDGITHGLDMSTVAKGEFLQTFHDRILAPRNLDYKVQFPGPTGTNAVESALKLARKVTGRESIVSFTNAFHGMTLGSLSVTGNATKRAGAGVPLVHSTPMPFDDYFDGAVEDFGWFTRVLDDHGSGLNRPAAVIVETIQGEGGVNVARAEWLSALAELCQSREILLIVDDVQMGCGRTGEFFSFEIADIKPDIVTLSKSISGYGLPMALTLLKPEHDVWNPGEHNGTFRGNNPAFVTATTALNKYWSDDLLTRDVHRKGAIISETFAGLSEKYEGVTHRGRGMVQGLVFDEPELAGKVCALAYEDRLLAETSGPSDEVVKLLPPLTIDEDDLQRGLDILSKAVAAVATERTPEVAE